MNEITENKRPWDVLLLGGASGTGKTSVSYPLARRFAVGITEVDDLFIVLERLTTPVQHPVLHYWRTHPDAAQLTAERIVELLIAIGRVLSPGLTAVIANHLDTQTPLVLEGDYLLPELLARPAEAQEPNTARVRGVFLYEADEGQLRQNLSVREPEAGEQAKRARVSWLYGQWLKAECERFGVAALPARPWETLLDRINEAIT